VAKPGEGCGGLSLFCGEGRGEVRIWICLRQPEIPFARNSRDSACSVSLFPRLRIRDMTSDRFRFVNTSGICF